MVSTHMRGAVIPTSVSEGFLRACTLRSVAYSSTLLVLIKNLLGTERYINTMNITSFFLKMAFVSCFCLSLTSCKNWYYCTLNSRGSSPLEKTYYVVSPDSAVNKTLEFQEYANILKEHLNEVGYIEGLPQYAALCIELDYGMGETYLANSTTTVNNYSSTYTNTNIKSNSNANASVKTNAYANYNQLNVKTNGQENSTTKTNIGQTSHTFGSTTSGTTNIYKIPLFVSVKAFDNQSGEPIWEVTAKDELDRETQMQSVMPWLLLATKEYIGKSSYGEQTVKIDNKKEIKEKYKLVWPYKSQLF